jgi:hypothetical protein
MKHSFSILYELDCTLGEAVAAYLDAEHYAHLHGKHLTHFKVLDADGTKIRVVQYWVFLGIKIGNECIMEYVPPGQFLQYHFKSYPHWLPSIYHLIRVHTDLRYTPDSTGTRTVSDIMIDLSLPFWMWPLRHTIEKKLRALKIEKDQEDIDMVARRQKLFGRGNLASYFVPHQFMLHKELFAKHFAPAAPLKTSENV